MTLTALLILMIPLKGQSERCSKVKPLCLQQLIYQHYMGPGQILYEEIIVLTLLPMACDFLFLLPFGLRCQGRPQLASPLTMTKGFEVLDGVMADLSI